MPDWYVPERIYAIPRDIAFLDTNVLVALANPADQWHEQTLTILELGEFKWAVTDFNLVEAWNLLVGRDKRRDLAFSLMQWVLTPGSVMLIGESIESIAEAHEYSNRFRIDFVDALLLELADRVSRKCNIIPSVHVATYDVRDFLRLFGPSGLSFNVYDMRDISSTTGYS